MGESFGDMFKRLRIESGQTLRAFCIANGLDAGNVSKMERGRALPPETVEIVSGYARMLGLSSGSEDWQTFHDLAAAARGRIPPELLSDKEVVDKLPVLFRVLRNGSKGGSDPLAELVEKIRRA